MQALIALSSAFITAVYFVYISRIMKRRQDVSSTLTLAAGHIVAAAALLPVWLMYCHPSLGTLVTPSMVTLLLMTAGLLVVSRELYFYAYARTDVANITVFSALTPVYALGIAFIFLGEVPPVNALMGLLLICGSIYALFLKRQPGRPLAANILQPFRHVASSPPILCAFLSTIPTAFAATFQKQLLYSLDPVSFSFFLLLVIGVLATGISLAMYRPAQLLAQAKQLPPGFFVASALLLPAMHVFFCLVMKDQQTAISLVLQRTSIMFQIVIAYFFLRERQEMPKRVTVAGFIIVGFLLILG